MSETSYTSATLDYAIRYYMSTALDYEARDYIYECYLR